MKESGVTIAVVAPREPFDFFDTVWDGAWSAAYELASLNVRVLTCSTQTLDCDEQAQVLRDLLAEKVQAIVLTPAHPSALNSLIEQHAHQGTPVITLFTDAPASRRACFVGPDARQEGKLAGELLARLARPHAHILALTGSRHTLNTGDRFDGFREALVSSRAPLGLTEIDDAETFAAIMGSAGSAFDGLCIGCPETVNTADILRQLKPSVPCVSFHLTASIQPFLQSGVVSAVVDSARFHQGYIAVQQACEYLLTKTREADKIRVPSSVVLAPHLRGMATSPSLDAVLEMLIQQRTMQLRSHKHAVTVANARVSIQSGRDSLTGLLTKSSFERVLDAELSIMRETSSLSLLLINLDHLQSINSQFGNLAGDRALHLVVDTLMSVCRSSDTLARLGPDEFAVLLPGTHREPALSLSERILTAVGSARLPSHPDIRISVSIGVASIPPDARTPEEMIGRARRSLDEIKFRRRSPKERLLKIVS